MKSFAKPLVSLFLILTLLMSLFAFAGAANEKQYHDYGSYVLLGDSVASGWSDVKHVNSSFNRVDESYGAYVADDLGVVYHPMACIGFRTVEMRYMFEDDFEGDRFLFYSISHEEMEYHIPRVRKAVAEAGLITLNVGGNDWGSYLGWHVLEEMDKVKAGNEEFFTKAEETLKSAGVQEDTIESIVDIAALTGCLDDLVSILPKALKKGFTDFVENWDHVVEDIYALNPDVTLVVIGMFDNSVQDQETADKNEAAIVKASLGQTIVDIANKPMIDKAEEYNYIFVDPVGTVCEENHPSAAGHRHIADLILEALPEATFPYNDVRIGHKNYKAVEYVYQNSLMAGTESNKFSPDTAVTAEDFVSAMNKLTGKTIAVEGDGVSRFAAAKAVMSCADRNETSFNAYIKTVILAAKTLIGSDFSFTHKLTRAEAAQVVTDYAEIL